MPSHNLRRWAADRYGANPLQALAMLACFSLAGYAAGRVVDAGIWIGFLVWFVGAAIFHDFVFFPLYAGLDTTPYLAHWLLVTAVLFAGSAVAYALRVRADAGGSVPGGRPAG